MKKDVITLGRSSIELYSQDIGVPFKNIKGFNAFVGGSPLNIAIGCQRLVLKSVLITGIGNEKAREFIKNFLEKEKVNTNNVFTVKIARKLHNTNRNRARQILPGRQCRRESDQNSSNPKNTFRKI